MRSLAIGEAVYLVNFYRVMLVLKFSTGFSRTINISGLPVENFSKVCGKLKSFVENFAFNDSSAVSSFPALRQFPTGEIAFLAGQPCPLRQS